VLVLVLVVFFIVQELPFIQTVFVVDLYWSICLLCFYGTALLLFMPVCVTLAPALT
jgi:hypothetical protein